MTQLVAADIGGTHARFALATIAADGSVTLGQQETLRTQDFASLQTAWEAFSQRIGRPLPVAASFALAGPIDGDIIKLTNSHWTIRPAQLPEILGARQITILNDFAAIAHSIARAAPGDLAHLSGPDIPLPASGTISVVGPGTGLGVAHLWRDGQGSYHVQATEGGHMNFAPFDRIDDAVLARLRGRHRRVSVERVVSGPGIVDIYETLATLESRAVLEIDDRALWQKGILGDDSLASAAVERFCQALGGVAGDLALAHGAGGVVIAGGLGLRLQNTLPGSGFASRFCAKGRYEALMASLPVKLVTHPQPGLLGAAAAFAREYSEELS